MWEMPFTVVRVTARIIYTTLKAGFSMIATITVMAAITEKKFNDRGNHMETSLQFEIAPNLNIRKKFSYFMRKCKTNHRI